MIYRRSHPAFASSFDRAVERMLTAQRNAIAGATYRNGIPRETVCHCGMQMLSGETCSVCGYKCETPND